jgi:D-alanyl-lipoteichoic acid acyltransferase DltB (MBOAT superfamily)
MCWYWQYAGILVCSTIVDYFIGRQLGYEGNPRNRRILLITSLTVNLGILAIFKYYNFFYESSQAIFNLIGFSIPDMYHKLLLPMGISFYTFQTLSYTIDVYRKELEPEKSFVKFAVFVSFFPQLVAGPIVRAKDFLPQINNPVFVAPEHQETGWNLIFLGLAKKILIADLLAYLAVDAIFENPGEYSSFDLVIGLYAYTFQIYCDFSGYTDIAIGVALLLGFKLPINFNRPYLAQSPSDFWKRWHISLSSWLRDYLYISLGGNRVNKWITYRNLIITMVLGGLWHGAAWNFVLWGAFHGFILILFRNVVSEHQFSFKMIAKIFVNFHLIVFGWLLFRSTSVDNFIQYVDGVSRLEGRTVLNPLLYIILGIAAFSHFVPQDFYDRTIVTCFNNLALPLKSLLYWAMLCLFVGASVGSPVFIYFQF